jgi:hypothetical protein
LFKWLRELPDDYHIFLDILGTDFQMECLIVKARAMISVTSDPNHYVKTPKTALWTLRDGETLENPFPQRNIQCERLREFIFEMRPQLFPPTKDKPALPKLDSLEIPTVIVLTAETYSRATPPVTTGRVYFRPAEFELFVRSYNWPSESKGGVSFKPQAIESLAKLLSMEAVNAQTILELAIYSPLENPYHFSGAVGGDRFRGRRLEILNAKNSLTAKTPTPVALIGLERTGKSSLGDEVLRQLTETGKFRPMRFEFFDSSPTKDITDVAGFLLLRLPEKERITHIIDIMNKSEKSVGLQRDLFRMALTELKKKTGIETVLFIDELSRLEERSAGPGHDTFLEFLESIARDRLLGVRIMVSARPSILSNPVFQKANTFRIFHIVPVASVDDHAARQIIALGSPNIDYDESAVQRILTLTGRNPYWIQLICFYIYEASRLIEKQPVSIDLVDAVFERLLTTPSAQAYFRPLYRDVEQMTATMRALRRIAELAANQSLRVDYDQVLLEFNGDVEKLDAALLPLTNHEILVLDVHDGKTLLSFKAEALRRWLRIQYHFS